MTLIEYIGSMATKLNSMSAEGGMTAAEREELDALVARVAALENKVNLGLANLESRVKVLEGQIVPLVGEISGLPPIV